jgi:hypothetical protein
MKVVVYHRNFGCDTGCCGHAIEVDGEEREFTFDHPDDTQDPRTFARDIVEEALGTEHVADLDWDNCLILECW